MGILRKTMKVEVTVVPTSGTTTKKTVQVAMSGATVAEVAKAAGVSLENRDVLVNGKPAKPETHIGPKDKVTAKDKPSATMEVAERPQGS
jgi:hypothetical protein